MTKTLSTTFVAALLAASAYGGSAAFAAGGDGDYYSGASKQPVQNQPIDGFRTNSIGSRAVVENRTVENVGPANGDYYSGADRNASSPR